MLIAVTHLLGAGHLTRAAALARAFAAEGHETTLVSGGGPVQPRWLDRVTFVQLPPVHIKGTDFSTLLDETGGPLDDALLDRRRLCLLQSLEKVRPDIVITELFPFGRRILAGEFTALVDAAKGMRPRPLILCSVRDILVAPAKPEKVEEAHERILRDFDAVLVHGDPQLIPLEASWPVDERIRPLLHYTGYVDENPDPVLDQERWGIIVSGGSSAASLPLYRAALMAARKIPDRPWRVLVGRGISEEDFRDLQENAPAHAAVERARADFRDLLAGAEISISQAGYNTVVDILRSRVKPVLVPFEGGHETEQRLRAECLRALRAAEIVAEQGLTSERLVEAVRESLSRAPSLPSSLALDGARESVVIAGQLALSRPAFYRKIDWSPLGHALEIAKDRGCPVRFWWRDDDAVEPTPQLDRLLQLAGRYGTALGLAVIPERLHASLRERLTEETGVFALVHGLSHANHAPPGEKKAEFGSHRPIDRMAVEAGRALSIARKALGPKMLPVFVPPWNRIAPELIQLLPQQGFAALSTFSDRNSATPSATLLQINTHIDPIDWRGTRCLANPESIVASLTSAVERRIDGRADRKEPIGILTHHLIHDEAIWSFCEELIVYLLSQNLSFLRVERMFHGARQFTGEAQCVMLKAAGGADAGAAPVDPSADGRL